MRRVLPDKRGVAGLGCCGHQPGTLGRPPQVERQRVWAGTPVHQPPGRERQTPGGRNEHPPGLLLATGSGSCAASAAQRHF
jgi:hypothetical protein